MLAAEWVVAKYIEDLRRGEARNIGVILRIGDDVRARFKFEDAENDIDEESASLFFADVDNYKAWLAYWRYRMSKAAEVGLDKAFRFDNPSNFVMVQGGERLVGEVVDPAEMLDSLYEALVA